MLLVLWMYCTKLLRWSVRRAGAGAAWVLGWRFVSRGGGHEHTCAITPPRWRPMSTELPLHPHHPTPPPHQPARGAAPSPLTTAPGVTCARCVARRPPAWWACWPPPRSRGQQPSWQATPWCSGRRSARVRVGGRGQEGGGQRKATCEPPPKACACPLEGVHATAQHLGQALDGVHAHRAARRVVGEDARHLLHG